MSQGPIDNNIPSTSEGMLFVLAMAMLAVLTKVGLLRRKNGGSHEPRGESPEMLALEKQVAELRLREHARDQEELAEWKAGMEIKYATLKNEIDHLRFLVHQISNQRHLK